MKRRTTLQLPATCYLGESTLLTHSGFLLDAFAMQFGIRVENVLLCRSRASSRVSFFSLLFSPDSAFASLMRCPIIINGRSTVSSFPASALFRSSLPPDIRNQRPETISAALWSSPLALVENESLPKSENKPVALQLEIELNIEERERERPLSDYCNICACRTSVSAPAVLHAK